MNTISALQSIQSSLSHFANEWVLVFTFFIALLFDLFTKRKEMLVYLTFIGIVCSAYLLILQYNSISEPLSLFNNFYQLSKTTITFKLIISLSAIVVLLPYLLKSFKYKNAEFFYLFPLLILSANLLSMSSHLLSILIGVEFLSILSYLYIAFEIKNKQNAESSTKYVVYGAFSSAIMLYGISWLYALSGTLYLDANFLAELSKASTSMVAMAILIFSAGFLFKISATPFHYYSPDVYEGSSPSTLAFISTIPKIAGFAVLFAFVSRFHFNYQGMMLAWPHFPWEKVLSIIAIASMFVGNLSALSQQNLKRIFAYSSISHTGFILMGLIVYSNTGLEALVYYLVVYTISNFAAFFILQIWESKYGIIELKQLIGLGKKDKLSASLMVLLLASFTGLPPLAGFVAKFFIFSSVFEQYQISYEPWLIYVLIAGVLNTVIALFYYFNIARYLFLKSGEFISPTISVIKNEKILMLLILLLSIGLIYLGLNPFSLN